MAKKPEIVVNGRLNLDVVLGNLKDIDRQLQKVSRLAGTAKQKDGVVLDSKDYIQDVSNRGRKSIEQGLKGLQEFAGKDVFNLSPRQEKRYKAALGGYLNGIEDLKESTKATKAAFGDITDPKQRKILTQLSNENAALLKTQSKYVGELGKLNPELTRLAAAYKAEAQTILRSNQARKLVEKRQEANAKQAAARTLIGKKVSQVTPGDIQSFTPQQKKAVQDALTSRLALARQRQQSQGKFGESKSAQDAANEAVKRGTAGLEAYNTQQNYLSQLSAKARENLRQETEQLRYQREQRALDAKDAAALTKRRTQEASARSQGRKVVEEEQKAQTAGIKKLQALEEAATKQKQKDEDKFYASREKARQDDKKKVEAAAAAQVKQNEARLRVLRRAERAAYAEEQKLQAARKSYQDKRNAERLDLALKKRSAQDVFDKYGATKGFGNLDTRRVSREDLGTLQRYAAAEQKFAKATLDRANAQNKSKSTVAALSAELKRHNLVVRQLEDRYRSLHSPLAQVNLLFRQFFRFAIGYGVLYQALAAVKALIGGVVDLDAALKSIQAITASTDGEMRSLEVTIKRVATTTKFTTTEIAKATQILGQAGVSAAELPAALEATANFAAATASELEIAADLLTTTRNVFKDLSDNTLSDQLTKAINISKLNAADLKTILSISAQTAKAYNLTSEQYLSAATTLRNAGIKASTVATGLRQGLLEIFSPTAGAIKALKQRYRQLGEDLTNEAIKQRFFGFTKADNPLLAVLTELKRIGFADDAQKEFQRAFNVRAANAIKALIQNYDQLAEAESRITFGLAAAEAAETQMESLSNSLSNLGAAFTVFGDVVLGGAVGGLEDFVDSTTDAINALNNLDIQLKKQGKSGLGTSLVPALTGGVAGSLLGKTVKGRLGLGLLGTASGGAAGLLGTDGGAAATAGGAAGTGILTILLGALGLKGAKGYSAAKGKGALQDDLFGGVGSQSATKNFLAGNTTTKGFAGLSKLTNKAGGGLVLRFLPFIGPILNIVLIMTGIVSTLNALFDEGGTELEQAENRLQGSLADLENIRAARGDTQDRIDEFDVNAAESGDTAGKTANTLVRLSKQFQDYRAAIRRGFGDLSGLTEDELAQFDDAIQNFAGSTLAGRQTLSRQIKEITGSDKTIKEIDQIAFDISTNINGLQSSVKGILGDLNKSMTDVFDNLAEAELRGEDPEQRDLDIAKLFYESDDLRNALLGRGDATAEQINQYVSNFVQGISEIDRKILEESDQALSDAIDDNLTATIAKVIKDNKAQPAIDIEITLKRLVDEFVALGDFTKENVERFRQLILDTRSDLEAQQPTERQVSIPLGGGEVTTGDPLLNKNPAIAALGGVLEYYDTEVNRVAEAATAAQEKLRRDSVAAVERFEELTKTDAGLSAIGVALEGFSGSTSKELVDQLLSAPEKLQGFINEIENEAIESSKSGAPKFTKDLYNQILKILVNAGEIANTALQSEEELTAYRKILPNPDDIAAIDEQTRLIRNLQGKNKENIDRLLYDVESNPINIRAGAQVREQERTIARTRNEIEDIAPGGDESQLDKVSLDKLNKLKTRLRKETGRIIDIEDERVAAIKDVNDKFDAIIRGNRKRAADLEIASANLDIKESGAGGGNEDLFNKSIAKIDAAQADLLQVFSEELIAQGISPGIEATKHIYALEIAEKERQLRDIRTNNDRFTKYLEEFTSGLERAAKTIANLPITRGVGEDAFSQRAGTEGRSRRRQQAENEINSNLLFRTSKVRQRDEQQATIDSGILDEENAALAARNVADLNSEIYKLDQASAAALITVRENSEDSAVRAQAAKERILRVQQLNEALQDSEYAFDKLADTINGGFLDVVEGIGDALAYAIIEGENFVDAMLDIFYDIFKEQATAGIKTLVTEAAGSLLNSAGAAGITNLIPGLGEAAGGKVVETATGAAADAVGAGVDAAATGTAVASAVTLALTPATLGLQTANTQLFLAGTTLNTAAGALTGAAAALTASATTSGATGALGGILATGGTIGRAGITNSYKGGGVISGPGTGTSDSILGVHMNGSKSSLIAVSNGESILTEKATNMLGEDFIHMVNSGKMKGFADGGVMGRGEVAAGAKPAEAAAAVAPSVTNKNDTTIVNAIDSSSVVAAALETPAGSRAILNYLRANRSKVSRIIG